MVIYLCFCKHKAGCNLEPLRPGQVLVLSELFLQLEELLAGERRPRPPRLAHQCVVSTCKYINVTRD